MVRTEQLKRLCGPSIISHRRGIQLNQSCFILANGCVCAYLLVEIGRISGELWVAKLMEREVVKWVERRMEINMYTKSKPIEFCKIVPNILC